MTDAVELVPVGDLDAAVVRVDGVVGLAGGAELPSAALACAHVRESRAGWIAADVARVLAGPYPDAVTAVEAVRAARERLPRGPRGARPPHPARDPPPPDTPPPRPGAG